MPKFFILWIKDIGHRRHIVHLCVRIFLEEFPHNTERYDRFLPEYSPFSVSLYFCREVIYNQNASAPNYAARIDQMYNYGIYYRKVKVRIAAIRNRSLWQQPQYLKMAEAWQH